MTAPGKVVELVERFPSISPHIKETQLRHEFIDPFFIALGWDVNNERGYAEAYKDVIHEDSIRVAGGTEAPDYCFRIGGDRKFFVEAKKPSIDIRGDIHPAYQLRRYAWSAKLPLSVLTDFEELAVYDCRFKPSRRDKPDRARTKYLRFEQYLDEWDELAEVFSREAVLKGSFDKYVKEAKRKKGTAEVDAAFLKEIERWRDTLARNIAARNPRLTVRELNFAVQRTIDRIIFLRICEDRGIERYGRLMSVTSGTRVYRRLFEFFQRADERYNSGLFHFEKERGRAEAPDELTPRLKLDDKPLKEIIRNLYYPESPYEFSVLPADILGHVYEQFLGKVIRLTKGHHAKVEHKPEVRKAGGVYYTPTYIVDYIVKNTVGKLLEKCKTPRAAAKLRILDPACGSGSFLLGAYQYLLDWHRDHYASHDPKKHARAKRVYEGRGGWNLTTKERKRILLDNIFGVDIDTQAVEVTKLSLLLKVLEGASRETIFRQRTLWGERALPDLSSNIKCGNSLIGPDFYETVDYEVDEDERYRINAFDWEAEFPEVFGRKNRGFDAVIGNPPYIRIQGLKEWAPLEVEFFKERYVSASRGNYDIYVVFVERGLGLLNTRGRLGFILPSKFLSTDYGASLRSLLSDSGVVDGIVDFGHAQVFQGATTYTCLLLLDRSKPREINYVRAMPALLQESSAEPERVPAKSLGGDAWLFVGTKGIGVLKKLERGTVPLLDLPVAMSRGTSTGADDVFCLVEEKGAMRTKERESVEVEEDLLRRPLYATDFSRYSVEPKNTERIIFPYVVTSAGYALIEERILRDRWPKAHDYLRSNRKKLEARKQCREWYGYSAPRNLHVHDRADFLVPLLADQGRCAPMPRKKDEVCVMAGAGFSVAVQAVDGGIDPLYVLGLANSKLLFWNLRLTSNKFRGGWITCTKQYFGKLPIRALDLSNRAEKVRHDRMVELVNRMLDMHRRWPKARTAHDKELIQRRIDATDREIDRLVYDLYRLTKKEIKIVEEVHQRGPGMRSIR